MVRLVDERGRPVGLPGEAPPLPPPNPSASAAVNSHDGTGSRLRGGACSGGSGAAAAVGGSGSGGGGGSAAEAGVQLVLLDFGLAEELTPAVRHHFISFLHHLLAGGLVRGLGRQPCLTRYPTAAHFSTLPGHHPSIDPPTSSLTR